MEKVENIWISNHACLRFWERVLAPNGLMFDRRFYPRRRSIKFLKDLSKKALLKAAMGESNNDGLYYVSWPYQNEPINELVLRIESKGKVLKTLWEEKQNKSDKIPNAGGD